MSKFVILIQGIKKDIYFYRVNAENYHEAYESTTVQNHKRQGRDVVIVWDDQIAKLMECLGVSSTLVEIID